MSVDWLRAMVRCDRCMKGFEVDLDTALEPAPGWSLFECVEDAVRGNPSSSVAKVGENEYEMLCSTCAEVEDLKED